jgi:hypothetical protein
MCEDGSSIALSNGADCALRRMRPMIKSGRKHEDGDQDSSKRNESESELRPGKGDAA